MTTVRIDQAAVMTFLLDRVNTFAKWDVVRYFYDNPEAVDHQRTIAQCVGRELMAVQTALDELAESGVLILVSRRPPRLYRLTHDTDIRTLIDQFMIAVEDQQFRMMAIQRIMAELR